jgi:DNA polymerase-3 subunit beta
MTTATLTPPAEIREATFGIDGRLLADTVALVAKAAGKSNLTAAVVLAFRDSRVTVSATDFDVAVSIKVPVKGRKAATVAVSAGKLVQFTKALAGEPIVEIVTGQDEVLIRSGDTVYHLSPVADFVPVNPPDAIDPQPFDLPAFARAVRIAGVAASTDQARPILTGIYFHEVKGEPTAVGTDSYRIVVADGAPAGLNALVPAAGARLACAVFADADTVTFDTTDRHLVLRSDVNVVSIRLLDGEFPNYADLFRKSDPITATVPRPAMVAALAKVALASNAGTSPVRAVTTGTDMHLSVTPSGQPHAHDDVELTDVSGELPTIGWNPLYLGQLLKAVTDDTVTFGFIDGRKPVTIHGDGTWKMLLMPVRIA